jgi:hypothetical protein
MAAKAKLDWITIAVVGIIIIILIRGFDIDKLFGRDTD